jgi:hypothetical protein
MKPEGVKACEILSAQSCVLIPRYQRRYAWGIENAHFLIRDIADVATSPAGVSHWTGVLIYRHASGLQKCAIGQKSANHICREMIDGQQRLATLQLWLQALVDHAAESDGPRLMKQMPHFTFQNPNNIQYERIRSGEDVSRLRDPVFRVYSYFRFLLWLGEDALLAPDPIDFPDGRLGGATREIHWEKWLERNVQNARVSGLIRSEHPDVPALFSASLEKIAFTGLLLESEIPERVFAALNGIRTELSQFDHLRNHCFAFIPDDRRDKVFDTYWAPAEDEFELLEIKRGSSRDKLKNQFLYDYLISLGEGAYGKFNARQSFSTFRSYVSSNRFPFAEGIEQWVGLSLGTEIALWKTQRERFENTDLPLGKKLLLSSSARRSLHRIRAASDGPPSPFVMWLLRRSLLGDSDPRRVTPDEVEHVLLKLEGYLFKTLLAGKSLTNMRAAVIGSMNAIDAACVSDTHASAGEKALKTIESWDDVKWANLRPDLENAYQRADDRGVYERLGSRGTLALLDAVSEHLTGNTGHGFLPNHWEHGGDPYWVEHIFPQKGSKKWLRDCKVWGVDANALGARMHDLGNLSALPSEINKDISNKTLQEKQAVVKRHPVATSSVLQDWLELDEWSPQSIDDRSYGFIVALHERWPDSPHS